tara:strand:+ start:6573 stop:7169 length:597 start_codon:yes stop_codon:yes gene_type:complete
MKRAIVIQGPTNYYELMSSTWKGDKIISTWENEKIKIKKNEILVLNKIPKEKGTANLNLQKISTLNGLLKAKELGYKRAIKTRSDLFPTDFQQFEKLLNTNYRLNATYWCLNDDGYIVDYIYEGEIDTLIDCFSFDDIYPEYAEKSLNKNIMKVCGPTEINFYGNSLSPTNDLVWIKNSKTLYHHYSNHHKFINYVPK